MENVLPFIGIALLVLACPLGMAAIGGVAWVVARAQGKKRDMSMGCMGGHGEQQPTEVSSEESALREEVARLRSEVEALNARARVANGVISAASEATAERHG